MSAISAVSVTVDGRALGPESGRLLAVRVVSRLGQPTQCELTFGPGDGPRAVGWGAALDVAVRGDEASLFTGEVTCVELLRSAGPAAYRVRGYDRLHRLRGRQATRVMTDVTAVDVASEIVADLDLTVSAERDGPRLDRLVQHGQSDLDELARTAAAAGLYPTLRGGTLHLVDLSGTGPAVRLTWGTDLWEAAIESNLDGVAQRVTAIGWHPQRAEAMESTAVASGTKAEGEALLVGQSARSHDGLAALAQAEADRRAARAVTLRGTAAGSARLVAATPVELRGVGEGFDGEYVVTSAVHTIDGSGYQTVFSTQAPDPPALPSAASITLGTVSAVDDPDGLGRVRISLPALGDLDAGWLGVLCPGAGRGRGLVALPDVGDTVVVALPQGSPAAGIVLGAVYGTTEPPDPGVTGNAVKRWSLHTDDGQSLVVDDDEHRIRLETKDGNRLELAPGQVRLHATTDLLIDAPGHALTIRAASVDFEHAPLPVAL
jgi:uncharacterized protein involved in type VI secretion and phage assembly